MRPGKPRTVVPEGRMRAGKPRTGHLYFKMTLRLHEDSYTDCSLPFITRSRVLSKSSLSIRMDESPVSDVLKEESFFLSDVLERSRFSRKGLPLLYETLEKKKNDSETLDHT